MDAKPGSVRTALMGGTLGVLLLLSGCGLTSQGDALRDMIAARGADMADKTLENSVWGLCELSSFGSIMRRYGGSMDTMSRFTDFCWPRQHTPFESLRASPEEVTPPKIEPFPTPKE